MSTILNHYLRFHGRQYYGLLLRIPPRICAAFWGPLLILAVFKHLWVPSKKCATLDNACSEYCEILYTPVYPCIHPVIPLYTPVYPCMSPDRTDHCHSHVYPCILMYSLSSRDVATNTTASSPVTSANGTKFSIQYGSGSLTAISLQE